MASMIRMAVEDGLACSLHPLYNHGEQGKTGRIEMMSEAVKKPFSSLRQSGLIDPPV